MNKLDTILKSAVDSYKPSTKTADRIKRKILPKNASVTVVMLNDNFNEIFERVQKKNRETQERVLKKLFSNIFK